MKPSNLPRIITSRPSTKPTQPQPATITQSALNQSIEQRRRLKTAEYSSKDPVQSNVKTRGEILERRIAQLQQENHNK